MTVETKAMKTMIDPGSTRGLIAHAIVYFVVALGCVLGADHAPSTWHDALLLIAGVCLGGAAAMVTLLALKRKAEIADVTKKEAK